ncbi:MAG TPA: hypothetical protein VHU92_15440 [Streptosporangiaceae bacterium]|nr:hypothetical protein [Streptosporangiaceae bacterium]
MLAPLAPQSPGAVHDTDRTCVLPSGVGTGVPGTVSAVPQVPPDSVTTKPAE